MAHFTVIGNNDTVIDMVYVDNGDINNLDFPESEPVGIEFLNSIMPQSYLEDQYPGHNNIYFKQCSYNENFRFSYPGVGYTYNLSLDRFVPPKPYDSWIYSSEFNNWDSPVPNNLGEDVMNPIWDEENQTWVDPLA